MFVRDDTHFVQNTLKRLNEAIDILAHSLDCAGSDVFVGDGDGFAQNRCRDLEEENRKLRLRNAHLEAVCRKAGLRIDHLSAVIEDILGGVTSGIR